MIKQLTFQPTFVQPNVGKPTPEQRPVFKTSSPAPDTFSLSKTRQKPPDNRTNPPAIHFGHQLTRQDYVVSHGYDLPITLDTAGRTLQMLMINALYKQAQEDSSNLKYELHSNLRDFPRKFAPTKPESILALADAITLIGRPVDAIIQGSPGSISLFPLLTARLNPSGRLYMGQHADLNMGPFTTEFGGTLHDSHIQRERRNEFIRDLETLIMITSGEKNRSKVSNDLNGGKALTPLECLAYGSKGLIDAILIGDRFVLTRQQLDEYYRSQDWGKNNKKIQRFNSSQNSIEKIPVSFLMPLEKYNTASVTTVSSTRPLYQTLGQEKDDTEPFEVYRRDIGQAFSKHPIPKRFLRESVSGKSNSTAQLHWKNTFSVPAVIYDDWIMMESGFNQFSAEQTRQALQALENKKIEQRQSGKQPGHIKILLNSNGGRISALDEIRNEIAQSSLPVDIIAYGMAASCGGVLLSSATGNRLGTMNARILIHQNRWPAQGIETYKQNDYHNDSEQLWLEKSCAQISKSSGRDFNDVWQDMKQDTWLNPLEALFYGSRGLLDGVLVDSNRALTKTDVLSYLKTDPGTQQFLNEKYHRKTPSENVDAYLQDHLQKLREPNRYHDPGQWEKEYGQDPLNNPLKTLITLAPQARPLEQIPELAGSASHAGNSVDQFIVHNQE
jgi:ATP-dependent protease ClpP protease subunit